MKIKTITDEMWDELGVKPFIFIGFHAYQSKIIAVAIDDEGICAFKVIDDSHSTRQNFFSEIRTRYKDSPIAISNRKTERYWENLLEEKNGKCTPLKIVLKGPEEKLKSWESEVKSALLKRETVEFSVDNPIQCLNL
ncbi:MAG: hypothetical protein LBQ03_03295 [Puniceicoccales bacterium]|jgi:hypothetical protein|nr:hypothetical protein [Puniceicoccales bacterium]